MPNTPKHIMLIGPAYPYRGGLAAFNERLGHALQATGYQVTLLTFTLQYPGFLFPGKTQFSNDAAPADLTIVRKINAVNPLNWLRVGWWLRQQKMDVILTAFWLPFMGPSLGTVLRLARRSQTKSLGLIHNIIPHEKRPGDHLFARYFTGALDGAICLSDSVQEDLQQFTKVPTAVSPHPVYDSYGEPVAKTSAKETLDLEEEPNYILFFGFIRDYKGLDLLLRAMADERMCKYDIKLIVAGEFYGNELTYRELIDELGIADRLILHTQFIANDKVKYYFGAADLVVQPYRTATQSGISQLAYYFEKPMVVTRVGGLPEIVPHGKAGYVVDQSPETIADAIVDFFVNQRDQALQAGVQAGKRRYSWSALVSKLQTLMS